MRYLVAFIAVVLGVAAAVADVGLTMRLLPPHQPGHRNMSPEENRMVLDACITFYATVYGTGRFLYRWRGAHGEAEELQRWSGSHLLVLNMLGGVWLIISGCLVLQKGNVFPPSLVVGAALLTFTLYDLWQTRRAKTTGG